MLKTKQRKLILFGLCVTAVSVFMPVFATLRYDRVGSSSKSGLLCTIADEDPNCADIASTSIVPLYRVYLFEGSYRTPSGTEYKETYGLKHNWWQLWAPATIAAGSGLYGLLALGFFLLNKSKRT